MYFLDLLFHPNGRLIGHFVLLLCMLHVACFVACFACCMLHSMMYLYHTRKSKCLWVGLKTWRASCQTLHLIIKRKNIICFNNLLCKLMVFYRGLLFWSSTGWITDQTLPVLSGDTSRLTETVVWRALPVPTTCPHYHYCGMKEQRTGVLCVTSCGPSPARGPRTVRAAGSAPPAWTRPGSASRRRAARARWVAPRWSWCDSCAASVCPARPRPPTSRPPFSPCTRISLLDGPRVNTLLRTLSAAHRWPRRGGPSQGPPLGLAVSL